MEKSSLSNAVETITGLIESCVSHSKTSSSLVMHSMASNGFLLFLYEDMVLS